MKIGDDEMGKAKMTNLEEEGEEEGENLTKRYVEIVIAMRRCLHRLTQSAWFLNSASVDDIIRNL